LSHEGFVAALESAQEKAHLLASLGSWMVIAATGRRLFSALVTTVGGRRTKLRHYPNIDRAEMFEKGYVAAKSGHSRGSTVDLTLYDLATGELAPMAVP